MAAKGWEEGDLLPKNAVSRFAYALLNTITSALGCPHIRYPIRSPLEK